MFIGGLTAVSLVTDRANNLVPNKGKLWRFAATVGAWLQALDYTSFDYTQDRIDRLERKVARLTEELSQSRRLAFVTLHPNDESYSRVPT